MNDLISRQAAIDAVADLYWMDERLLNFKKEIDATLDKVKALPSADPVKHGKWIPFEFGDETWHKCTACGAADKYGTKHISHIPGKFHIVYAIRNYCPNCGARMDGEE